MQRLKTVRSQRWRSRDLSLPLHSFPFSFCETESCQEYTEDHKVDEDGSSRKIQQSGERTQTC